MTSLIGRVTDTDWLAQIRGRRRARVRSRATTAAKPVHRSAHRRRVDDVRDDRSARGIGAIGGSAASDAHGSAPRARAANSATVGRLNRRRHFEIRPRGRVDAAHELRAAQRIAAKLEEVVEGADGWPHRSTSAKRRPTISSSRLLRGGVNGGRRRVRMSVAIAARSSFPATERRQRVRRARSGSAP